jgi:hypothetical protein
MMIEYQSILKLLEAERERYILEAAELERRLQHARHQIVNLESLICGYATEEQMDLKQRHLCDLSSTQAILQDASEDSEYLSDETDSTDDEEDPDPELYSSETADNDVHTQTSSLIPNNSSATVSESTVNSAVQLDISDIPKLTTPRKPRTLPLLPEFEEYSLQNAILILMRRRPDLHMHIDAVVRDVYGEQLRPQQLKTATSNVGKMLSDGVQRGLWYRVLRANGVYTLNFDKGITSKQLTKK